MAKVILTSKSSAMKSYLPFLSLVVIFASCTSAYKSGQTPDDVYFSPARPENEYVRAEKNEDRQYQSDEEYRDDRYLRMKVRNHRWSVLDDDYAYSYSYNYNYYPSNSYAYFNRWNAASLWNFYYNPYCCCNTVIINNPKSQVYNKPRTVNLRVFDNLPVTPSTNPKASGYSNNARSRTATSSGNDNYRNSNSSAGNFLRNVFGNSGSNSSGTDYKSGSSSSGSSSSGSSSSGSGGGSRGNATRGRN